MQETISRATSPHPHTYSESCRTNSDNGFATDGAGIQPTAGVFGSLGKVLYEESINHLDARIVAAVAVILSATFCYLHLVAGLVIGAVLLALSAFAFLQKAKGIEILRIHENGVSLLRNEDLIAIPYQRVIRFQFRVQDQYDKDNASDDREWVEMCMEQKIKTFTKFEIKYLDEQESQQSIRYRSSEHSTAFLTMKEACEKAVAANSNR